jgi:GNAT superfamily N-acetyltransferase
MPHPTQIGIDPPAIAWTVGHASHGDVSGIVVAVQELLLELGGMPPPTPDLTATARELVDDPSTGAVLVARVDSEVIAVLAASWQIAIHAAGEYATIQDLWVQPTWRNRSIGRELIDALVEVCRERDITRIEVGLPHKRFRALRATEAFYRENGFAPLGPRMRRALT